MPDLLAQLRATLGRRHVLSAPSEVAVYDCDALTIERRSPLAVVLPGSTAEVADVVKICRQFETPIVARGAGTSLAGGCVPCPGGVVLSLARMNRVVEIDLRNRMAVVEAGVTNLRLAQALAGTGFHFAPDPSSQGASTIGGNVATNAGGPHTLKYGVTVNHVLGLEVVLADGRVVQLGPVERPGRLDLIGILVGSEGTLGIVTKVWTRLTPNPAQYRTLRAVFASLEEAGAAVSRIIAAGIVPSAMELMDRGILDAVEEAYHFGFPPDADAVLVVDLDGPEAGLDRQASQIVELCKRHGAGEVLLADSDQQRELLWKCRKMAVGATGRLSPSYTIQDGVVPRTRLPHIMRRMAEIGKKHQIRIVNVAHAGDGNIHPILLFDQRDAEQVRRAVEAGREILEECIAQGGSITAEHGIGIEKIDMMDRLFAPADLEAMRRVRHAFDPAGLFNPDKLLPPHPSRLSRLSHLSSADYPADDMTITVDAKTTIAELSKRLAENRQWLPVDVARPDQTTIGQAILFDAAGPRQCAYGAMRDYLLGFTAREGRGESFSGGGRVGKNAAGYNMCRLMAGSRGALAELIQVTLMVRPMPEASVLLVCDVPELAVGEKLLAQLAVSDLRPAAVEFSAGRPPAGQSVLGPVLAGNVGRLYVGFEGATEDVDWMVDRLRGQWAASGAVAPMLVPSGRTGPVWQWLTEFPAQRQVHVLPSEVIATIAKLLDRRPDAAILAHAAQGIILMDRAEGGEGRADIVQGLGTSMPSNNDQSPQSQLLQSLKERFDPENRFPPVCGSSCNLTSP